MRHLILLSFPSLIFLGSCVVPESNHVEPDFYLLSTVLADENQANSESEKSFYINQVQLPRYLQDSRLSFGKTKGGENPWRRGSLVSWVPTWG